MSVYGREPRIDIINVLSVKGGVGKTLVSASLCQALIRMGFAVLYFDMDFEGTSARDLFSTLLREPNLPRENIADSLVTSDLTMDNVSRCLQRGNDSHLSCMFTQPIRDSLQGTGGREARLQNEHELVWSNVYRTIALFETHRRADDRDRTRPLVVVLDHGAGLSRRKTYNFKHSSANNKRIQNWFERNDPIWNQRNSHHFLFVLTDDKSDVDETTRTVRSFVDQLRVTGPAPTEGPFQEAPLTHLHLVGNKLSAPSGDPKKHREYLDWYGVWLKLHVLNWGLELIRKDDDTTSFVSNGSGVVVSIAEPIPLEAHHHVGGLLAHYERVRLEARQTPFEKHMDVLRTTLSDLSFEFSFSYIEDSCFRNVIQLIGDK